MLSYCCLDLNWLELDLKLDLWNHYSKIHKTISVSVDWSRICCKVFVKLGSDFLKGISELWSWG